MNQAYSRWTLVITVFLTLVPLAVLIYQAFINYVDVPFWDQWQFIPILMKYNDHTLTFHDLFQAHNEHRIFFPRIIMLSLATLSDWNAAYEIAFIILLAIFILVALIYMAAQSFDDIPPVTWLWAMPTLAVLVFSLRQHQNWLWGWQISMFLNIAAFCWAVALLGNRKESLTLFFASLCLACISTFSFANGLLFWVLGFPLLLQHQHKRLLKVVIWIIVSTIVYIAYFHGFKPPHSDPSTAAPLDYLMQVSNFFLILVGSLVVKEKESRAMLAASILIVCFLYASSVILLKYKNVRDLLPLWTLGLYSAASAALTTFGRSGKGAEYAFQSRYTTVMVPLWSALLILLFYLIVKKNVNGRLKNRLHSGLALVLFMVITVSAAKTSLRYVDAFRDVNRNLTIGRDELLRLPQHEHKEPFENLCWSPDLVVSNGIWLKEHRLSLFRATGNAP